MRRRGPRAASRAGERSKASYLRLLDYVIIVVSVGAVASLVYLLFRLMSGALAAPIIGGSALESTTRKLLVARDVFLWTLWIVVVAAMIRHYRNESVGVLTGLGGAACWVIMPVVVSSQVPATAAPPLAGLGQSLVTSFQTSGGTLVVLGVLRIALGRIILLTMVPQTSTAMKIPGRARELIASAEASSVDRPTLMRRCWELHFCRKSLRSTCPRYLEKTACWRKRSGCYCDRGLATRLLETVSANRRVQVAEELRAGQVGTEQRVPTRAASRPQQTSTKRGRPPCGDCPIYLEHQKYKYRALSWLSYPAAAVVIGLAYQHVRAAYQWVDWELSEILADMQVLPATLTDAPLEAASWLTAENAVVVIVGVITVGIILQLTEVAVFRFKW